MSRPSREEGLKIWGIVRSIWRRRRDTNLINIYIYLKKQIILFLGYFAELNQDLTIGKLPLHYIVS
jgi:hypothetical protein